MTNINSVYSATKARNDFFNILNKVIFGGETVYIKKEGASSLVKVESVASTDSILDELAGSVTDSDAKKMKAAIVRSREYPKRRLLSFD